MIKRLMVERMRQVKDQRYGDHYNPSATYHDACDEAIRRGDRTIGTEHLLLALLVDPESPAPKALGYDLESARAALDAMDREVLAAVGLKTGITGPPIGVRTRGRLRLTPAAKSVLVGILNTAQARRSGLEQVLNALLELERSDPAAELLTALGVDASTVRARFTEADR